MTEPDWLSADEQQTWRQFLATTQLLLSALDRELMRDAGIPHSHYGVLVALSEHPDGRRRLSDLAGLVDFSQSRLTHALTRMEAAGLVRRESRPSSGREKDAVLLPAGRALLERAAPGHVALVRQLLFDRLDRDQQAQLRGICAAVLPAVVQASGAEPGGFPQTLVAGCADAS
jgi:DNA-binding MarR family transcriptional regulator